MSEDGTMRPRRGFLPPQDADEVDADTQGPAAADDPSAAPQQWRPRRGWADVPARGRHSASDDDDENPSEDPPEEATGGSSQPPAPNGRRAVIETPPLVEAPAPRVEPGDAEGPHVVEYEVPIYRDQPASDAAPARSPSEVGGADDVHQHALFLPPDVEGSLSHTWILRALRDAEAADVTPATVAADTGPSPGVAAVEESQPEEEPDHPETEVVEVAHDAPEPGAHATSRAASLVRQLLPWLAGGVLAALLLGAIVLNTTRKPATVVTSAASAAGTEQAAMVTTSDLLTPQAAGAIDGTARWSAATTLTALDPSSPVAACLGPSGQSGDPRATSTALRTLTSDSRKGLAALHQIDGFQSDNDARIVFESRRTGLGTCDAVPMYIVGADAVHGLGDEAASVTVASQEKTTTFHTLLVVRTGRVIDTFDVAQNDAAVAASGLVKAASAVVSSQCTKSGGACTDSPGSATSAPPTGRLAGWLEVSDLPRFTPGSGEWTTTEAGAVSNTTTQCEGMTLASVNGPRTRQQRTYLLTQDSLAPPSFGLDELKFGFASADEAGRFARTLADGLGNCAKTMPAASVSEAASYSAPGSTTGVGTVSGRSFLITEKTGGNTSVYYRVAVVQLGNQVIYLMSNPSKAFGFDTRAIQAAAVRAAQRAAEVK